MDVKSFIDTRRRGDADVILFTAVLILAGIGVAMSYSASAVFSLKLYNDSFYFLKKQALWFLVGICFLMFFQRLDYRSYSGKTKVFLFISFIMLILVLMPGIGHSVKGSARWFAIGPFSLQPSEFVKIFMVLYLVKVFTAEAHDNHVIQFLIPLLIVAVMFVLIMLQPDFSTAVVLLLVSVLILFVSGFPIGYIVSLGIISIPMFYLLIYQVEYRRVRFLSYINPWNDRFGIGYHVVQSFIAFKKGGALGVGLGNGTQKIMRLPEPHTDFIYAVIAEETGLIGTILIILLFGVVLWRGMVISLSAPDKFGKLLAIGLTLFIFIQAMINVGVVTGCLPTSGLPLPFISYGGSSLLCNMIAAGILLNISRYRDVVHKGINLSEEVSG